MRLQFGPDRQAERYNPNSEVTKDTNIVCSNLSEAKLMAGRQGMQEQAKIVRVIIYE